jgi:glycosyltransferase involved in cell wall biosynthesis
VKISVIITSYNQKEYLKEAIESVLGQTYKPFEIVVCDDASQDSSQELIRDYEHKYPGLVRGILHEKNLGIPKNRNSGLKAVQGDMVTWLDGDDIFKPRKLELELKYYLESPGAKWVYSQVEVLDLCTGETYNRYNVAYAGSIFYEVIGNVGRDPRNPLVDYQSLKKIGFFDEKLNMYEDFDLCLRLAKHYDCTYCSTPLMQYRMHSSGTHRNEADRHRLYLDRLCPNFVSLIKNEPEHRKRMLVRRFLYGVDSIILNAYMQERESSRVFLYLFKLFRRRPLKFVLDPFTYFHFARLVLPERAINLVKKLLRGV